MATISQGQDPYLLVHQRDDVEEDYRLDRQYFMGKEEFFGGHTIHPAITSQISPTAVADIGCGTGVWLNDVSRNHRDGAKELMLVGWDLNESRFTRSKQPGVRLIKYDCTQPIPSEWHGKFDVVNISVLVYALTATSWPAVLDNAYKLLKVGGFLQWRETESTEFIPLNGSPEIQRSLQLWIEERRDRGLMQNMIDYMISAVSSATRRSGGGQEGQHLYQIYDFHLCSIHTPAQIRRDGLDCFRPPDELVLGATKLVLTGRLGRLSQLSGKLENSSDQDVNALWEQTEELESLIKYLGKAVEEKKIIFECKIPQLVARKVR